MQEKGGPAGNDSWDYAALANQISSQGLINWSTSILSFIGFSQPNQEIGGLVLYSAFSIMTVQEIIATSLLFPFILSQQAIFYCFIIGRYLFNSEFRAYLFSFSFISIKAVSKLTTWHFSNRILVSILILVLFYLILSSIINKSFKFGILALLFTLSLSTIHRIFLLLIIILICYVIILIFLHYSKSIYRIRFSLDLHTRVFFFLALHLILILLTYKQYIFNYNIFLGPYSGKNLLSEFNFFEALYYYGIRQALLIGLLILFVPVGIFSHIVQTNKKYVYSVIASLVYIFFIFDYEYSLYIFLPLLAFWISEGLIFLISLFPRRGFKTNMPYTIFVLILVLTPHLIQVEDSGKSSEEFRPVNASNFLSHYSVESNEIIFGYSTHESQIITYTDSLYWTDDYIDELESRKQVNINFENFIYKKKIEVLVGTEHNLTRYSINDPLTSKYLIDSNKNYVLYDPKYNENHYYGLNYRPVTNQLIKSSIEEKYKLFGDDHLSLLIL